ncbi:MAG: fatty acid desaturase family protein [Alphaproteobacteria bacterium]|nr:fatty acid desaturase family protein [Alphaproteobacteria bacterium]
MSVARFDPTKVFTPAEMAALRARSDLTGILCVAHAWIVIGAAMAIYAIWPNPFTFLAAVIVIGGRQLGLAILQHDAAHGALTRTRWLNEWLGQWLCAYPVLGNMVTYRRYHLMHHRTTQQPDDPDISLSAPFPITRASFRRKMIRDLTGQTGFKQRKQQLLYALGKPGEPISERVGTYWRRLGRQTIVNLVLLGLMSIFGKPHYYLMFWVLPNLTWHMVITRIRNIAEHAVVPDNDDVLKNARTTYASWLERALVAPYWVNYHVDHHVLFFVPCYRLPKLHALLLAKGYGPKMEIQPNYLTILKLATSKPELKLAHAA